MMSMYTYPCFGFEFKVGLNSNEVAQYLRTFQGSFFVLASPFSASLLQSAS